MLADALVTITGSGMGAAVTATVDPKTRGVTGYTVTGPGTGYTTAPMVAVTSPGEAAATGAAGTTVISTGVVTTITVAEAGFGFTTPSVAITGGGAPSTPATAQASGGVDNLTLAAGGAGYLIQPIVHFSAPDAAYCTRRVTVPVTASPCVTATGTATMTGGIVDGVTVATPGSGYKTAPTVDIFDGPAANATPATVAPPSGWEGWTLSTAARATTRCPP